MPRVNARLTSKGEKKLAQFLERLGLEIVGEAQRQCPVDTGRLRSSITYKVIRDGEDLKLIVGTNVQYAAFIEYGTGSRDLLPPEEPVMEWVRRVIQPDEDELEGVTWAVRKHIAEQGTRAQPFLHPAIETVLARYA